ncbi:MAG TPA: hypothetical protein QGF58_24335 [Myxococcota bacterium]|nr:hypothetical protein [Myxococcota bacterium]
MLLAEKKPEPDGGTPRPADSDQETRRARGRILLVEDEALVRKTLLRRLTRFGHDAVGVEDGAEARQIEGLLVLVKS